MPCDPGPETVGPSGEQRHEGRSVRFRVGVDHVRLYAAATGGAPALGFSVRIRSAFECALYLCAAVDDEGAAVGESEVGSTFPNSLLAFACVFSDWNRMSIIGGVLGADGSQIVLGIC